MNKQSRLWLLLWLWVCFATPVLLAESKQEIGFKGVVAETSFPAFNKMLQSGWGQDVMVHALKQELPHMEMTANRNARYFGIVKVPLVEYWQVHHKFLKDQSLFLVRVYLRLFVYDTETQSELLRETLSAYAAESWDKSGKELALVPLKKAFQQCVTLASQKIAQKLPLTGQVRKVISVDPGIIEVDRGSNHGISENCQFEVLNEKNESIGKFIVKSIYPEKSRAEIEGAAPTLQQNLVVRFVNQSKEQVFTKQEVLNQVFKDDFIVRQEVPVQPNPMEEIRITNPNNNHKTYLSREPGGIALEAKGYDAWGDEAALANKIQWQMVGNDEGLLPVGSSRFIPKKPGKFEIKAIYPRAGDKPLEAMVVIYVIQIKTVSLEPREVVLAPGDTFQFKVTGADSQNTPLTPGDLQDQLRSSFDGEKLATVNDSGVITAGTKGGRCILKIAALSTPSAQDQAEVFILPPIQMRVFDAQNNPITGKLVVAPQEDVMLRCDISGQEKVDLTGVDLTRLSVSWGLEQKEAGSIKPDNRICFFRAGSQETTVPFAMVVRVENVAPTSKRKDTEVKLWIEIKQQTFEVRIKPLRQPPYYTDDPIHLEVQGVVTGQNRPVKDLQFDLKPLGTGVNVDIKGGGFFTLTAPQPEEVVLIATEKKSGQEGRTSLIIEKATGVSDVKLTSDKFQRDLSPGQKLLLIPKAFRGNKELNGMKFTWSVSPANARVTVDDSGVLSSPANSEGEYEITATEITSKKSDKLTIRVLSEPVVDIQFDADTPKTIEKGKIYPLSVVLKGKEGNNLSGRKIVWTVWSNGVLRNDMIDENGSFKAVEPGYARVTARVDNVEKPVVIEVLPGIGTSKQLTVHHLEIKNTGNKSEIAPGETLQFVVQAFDSESKPLTNISFQWNVSSSSHKIGPDGFFTAGNNTGSVDVIATEPKSKTAKAVSLLVRWPLVSQIQLSIGGKNDAQLYAQESAPLTVQVFGQEKEPLKNYKVQWELSGGRVDDNNQFFAPDQAGTYKIVAKDQSGKIPSKPLFILVNEKPVATTVVHDKLQIDLQRDLINPGEETHLRARAHDTQNRWSYDVKVKWKISPPGNHTIQPDGTFRAGSQTGAFTIIAELPLAKGQPLTAEAKITVKRVPAEVRIEPMVVSLSPGMTQNFTAKVYDSQDNLLSDATVQWFSDGGTLRPQDNTCLFTAKPKPGSYEIAAKLNEQLLARAKIQIIKQEGEFVSKNNFGMTYQVPRTWQETIDTTSMPYTKYALYMLKEDEATAISFGSCQWEQSVDLQNLGKEVQEQLESSYLKMVEAGTLGLFGSEAYRSTRTENTTFGNISGRLVYYSIQPSGREPYNAVIFLSAHNLGYYAVFCLARSKEWDIHWPTFQSCLKSLRVQDGLVQDTVKLPEKTKNILDSVLDTPETPKPTMQFKEVKFFEAGTTLPPVNERRFVNRFAKSSSRYIYLHVVADNLYYDKQSQQPLILGKYYRPDGKLLGEVKMNPQIPADWSEVNAWSGWGWKDAGKWPLGTYRVEIFFGDQKAGEGRFEVVDDRLPLVFKELKFFEAGTKPPPIPQQQYATRFVKKETRYVYFAVLADNMLHNKKNQRADVTGKFYRPDGSLMGAPKATPEISSSWSEATVWSGWGWPKAGNWPTGTYRVEIFFGSEKVGEGTFEIVDDEAPLVFKELKFFESGAEAPPISEQKYTTRFAQQETRYVYFAVLAQNNWYDRQNQQAEVIGKYYLPDGSFMGEAPLSMEIPSTWSETTLWCAWGWPEPGNWPLGIYRVEIFFGGQKVGEGNFEIADDSQE
jgi:hypothetical protein